MSPTRAIFVKLLIEDAWLNYRKQTAQDLSFVEREKTQRASEGAVAARSIIGWVRNSNLLN